MPSSTSDALQVPAGWTVTTQQGMGEEFWTMLSPGIWACSVGPGQLLRFDPGAAWPGEDVHESGPEELVVVSGTLHLGIVGESVDHCVTPGSSVRAEQNTRHRPQAGPEGCLLFIPHQSLRRSADH
jgi:mannose-6-phosphate isomerase-like protein (cupin superfamily)